MSAVPPRLPGFPLELGSAAGTGQPTPAAYWHPGQGERQGRTGIGTGGGERKAVTPIQ